MMLYWILGGVFIFASVVIGLLFYLLSKESKEAKEEAVAMTDINELKKTLSLSEEAKLPALLQVPPVQEVQLVQQAKEISDMSAEFVQKEEVYQKRVLELEGELQTIATKAQEQSQQALSSIEQLKQENEQLKKEQNIQAMNVQAGLIQAEQTIGTLREEQAGLQIRLSESQAEVGKFQEEMFAMKQQMAQQIVKTKSETDRLVVENESLKRSLDAAALAQAAGSFQEEINALKQENQTLRNASQDLTLSIQKLKELNDHLIQKSDTLQWELTKARAQMTSYERACENYQIQLQGVFDQTGSIEENNSKLSETNNRLQTVLDDFKKQNEEFSKREKLFESELAKNRDQIMLLERDNANLKANISIQSDSPSQG